MNHDPKENKSIKFLGLNNRYQMKRLLTKGDAPNDQTRVVFSTTQKNSCLFKHTNQHIILETLLQHANNSLETSICVFDYPLKKIQSLIAKKIYSYKAQDQIKLRIDSVKDVANNYADLQFVLKLFQQKNLRCCYCDTALLICYRTRREKTQWTLDRIDNSKEHFDQNVVLSCLECNLKKKTNSSNDFLFTKNLQVTRLN